MADGPKKIDIVFTSKIVVNKVTRRADLPEFHIDCGSVEVDLRELAAEVLADYPEQLPLDVDTLARFAVLADERYVRVAEYPPDIDTEVMKTLIRRILRWANWPHKRSQLEDGGYFPARQFICDEDACPAARAMNGDIVRPTQSQRLPLKGCWVFCCTCDFRPLKRDDLKSTP